MMALAAPGHGGRPGSDLRLRTALLSSVEYYSVRMRQGAGDRAASYRTVLTEQEDRLVKRVLSSRQFEHANILKRILTYLVERSADPKAPPPKEYEIAVEAMGRPADFDPRIDPIVRVSVGSIRDRLQAFFATEGKAETVRMEIPRGQYRVVFSDSASNAVTPDRPGSALMGFWQPYFTGKAANVVVYTEPLFFRDNKSRYFRDWSVNSLETGATEIGRRFPGIDPSQIFPVFHYLSAGEVHCLLSITRMFHELGVPVETRNSRNRVSVLSLRSASKRKARCQDVHT